MGLRRNSHDQRQHKAVAFAAAVAGGVIALTSLAFACTPIVGLMTVENIHQNSPGFGSSSATVGKGRVEPGMAFCPGVPIVGGATGRQGDQVQITVAPAVCPTATDATLAEVTALATAVKAEVDECPPDPLIPDGDCDPRDLQNLLTNNIAIANFLYPDPAAKILFAPDTFNVSGSTYTYVDSGSGDTGDDCMAEGGSVVLAGTMVIGPGTGTATVTIPSSTVLPNTPTPLTNSGGVCVNSRLPAPVPSDQNGPAIAMAPITII